MQESVFTQLSFCFDDENLNAPALLAAPEEAGSYLAADPLIVLPISTAIDRVDPAACRIQDQPPVSAKNQANDHSTCTTKKKKSIQEKQTAKKPTKKAGRSKAIAAEAFAATAPPVHVVCEAPADDSEPPAYEQIASSGDLAAEAKLLSPADESEVLLVNQTSDVSAPVEPDEVPDPETLNIEPLCDDGVAGEADNARDSQPGSILSAGSDLKDVVRLAARAYSDDRSEYGNSISDGNDGEWDWLLDDRGRLVSPGRSRDTLADFIMTSIASVWDNATTAGNSPEKTMTAIGQELHRAADILGRCMDRIDALRNQDEDSESDRPISLREIIQGAAAGYTKAGKNAWNQLISEDGFFEAEADFEDLLATFVIREIGFGYNSSQSAVESIDNAVAGVACAQSRLRRVATSIAWSLELSFCY
jgi:hypothetical protein